MRDRDRWGGEGRERYGREEYDGGRYRSGGRAEYDRGSDGDRKRVSMGGTRERDEGTREGWSPYAGMGRDDDERQYGWGRGRQGIGGRSEREREYGYGQTNLRSGWSREGMGLQGEVSYGHS